MRKFPLMAAVVLAVAASAFTARYPSSNAGKWDPSFYWFNTSMVYHDLKTVVDEQVITGCDNLVPTLCENGYTASQLINPGNPSQGVKAGQTPVATIKRHS